MSSILKMTGIDKTFRIDKVLDQTSLEVDSGEIHALIGANGAGKSTLMRILCGELSFDAGEVVFDGNKFVSPELPFMQNKGIIMIHQELSTVRALTVAQYIYLGREPMKGLVIDDQKMNTDAAALLSQIDVTFSPNTKMSDLSIAEQQLVEITKAISYKVKLLIFDEPTTALGEKETEKVFKIIRSLKKNGVSVIYISHRLEELFVISDRITVMRDGKYITTLDTAKTDKTELIRLLAGKEITISQKIKSNVPKDAETVLEVRNLSASPLPTNISFSLKKGEILGLAGLMGSGRTETAKAICGINQKYEGTIFIEGKEVSINNPKDAIENGICYLSEDRNEEGLVSARSIIANTVIASLDKYTKGLSLSDEKMLSDALFYNGNVKTKFTDPHSPVSSLSGGNAQKVIIARWLLKNCPVFIFDEPTKGIDVGAKDEIYQIINKMASEGHSIIMISSETDELLNNCDRILILCEGKLSGELSIEEATKEKIMFYSTGEKIK